MPHSSGGGSHGGGYHSSSHSSSSSSSASGSGSSGSSTPPIRYVYYPGATRYVWYGPNGNVQNIYRSGIEERRKPSMGCLILTLLLISIFALPIILFFVSGGLHIPEALDTASYDANIVVADNAGILTDGNLEDALTAFREKTGIAPGVETVADASWSKDYTNLETFAYSEYLRLYDDEKHWLVVISWPEDAETASFINWSWEGMLGEDCSGAVDSDAEDAFTKIVQKHLLRATPETLGTELAAAYNEFSATCMDVRVSAGWLIAAAVVAALYAFLVFRRIRAYRDEKRLYEAVPAQKNAKERNCEYCGSLYIEGTVMKCPGCGAPIPAAGSGQQNARNEETPEK